ncbi:unnamed protein product [Paramecium primaurelia]|uniref:Transmembrane protein n=1 Tax=Paramecium primaurelia TaxID=5886 RepID=A0A8S1Q016_PARPR|nr:unnamed protein product [Paramecium primaurelia]
MEMQKQLIVQFKCYKGYFLYIIKYIIKIILYFYDEIQSQFVSGLYLYGNLAQQTNEIKYQNDTKQISESTLNSKTDVIKLIPKNRKQVKQLGQEATKEPQQLIIQLQDNKILMSQLCQPVVIHSHRIISSNKHSTLESPKFKRNCLHLDNPQNTIKHQHFLKKGGQMQNSQKETKPWYPFARIKRKQILTSFIDQKQAQNIQNNQIFTHFQSMADLTGWQTNDDPQMEMQ